MRDIANINKAGDARRSTSEKPLSISSGTAGGEKETTRVKISADEEKRSARLVAQWKF
jgi:hypothetical protein